MTESLPKCLVVQPILAHYRYGLIRELAACQGIDFVFLSDPDNLEGIRGIDPSLASASPEQGGFSWLFVRNVFPFGKSSILWQSGLIAELTRTDAKVVIFTGAVHYLSTWVATIICRIRGIRVVYWTHGFLRKEDSLKGFVRHFFYRLANAWFLYGDRAKALMLGSGFYAQDQLTVIYNSDNCDDVEHALSNFCESAQLELRKKLFDSPDRPILVCVGRLTSAKRFDVLLRALPFLKSIVNVLVIGDGPEFSNLKEIATTQSRAQVVFYGAAYGDECARLLVSSDISVIPGNAGLSVVLSMAAGLPVITHDCFDQQMPEFEAVGEGTTGSFYRFDDIKNLAEKVDYWVVRMRDGKFAKDKCIEIVRERYSSASHARRIINGVESQLRIVLQSKQARGGVDGC